MSINPVPQTPVAARPPTDQISIVPLSRARKTAPGRAGMPQLMFMPSKAGPAAVEVVISSWPALRTISPFVPRSMSRKWPSFQGIREASSPEEISPPTKLMMLGEK